MVIMDEKQIKPTIDNSFWNDIRYRIYGLLSVYPELSFTELAKKLGKSKSTLHPHLQKLIELGIVEISRKKHVRANIEAHYYSLTLEANEILSVAGPNLSHGIDKEVVKNMAKSWKSFVQYNRKILDKFIEFHEYLEETDSDDIVEMYKKIYRTVNHTKQDITHLFMGNFFFTENQWKRWQKLFYTLLLEFEEECIKEQKENPHQEKYMYFLNIHIPIKILFEDIESIKSINKK